MLSEKFRVGVVDHGCDSHTGVSARGIWYFFGLTIPGGIKLVASCPCHFATVPIIAFLYFGFRSGKPKTWPSMTERGAGAAWMSMLGTVSLTKATCDTIHLAEGSPEQTYLRVSIRRSCSARNESDVEKESIRAPSFRTNKLLGCSWGARWLLRASSMYATTVRMVM